MDKPKRDTFNQDLRSDIENGKKCELWDTKAVDMTKTQLIGFVGYLDNLISRERAERNK